MFDAFLGLRKRQIDEALAFRQVPVIHDAKQDAAYLNAACDCEHLGVDGERDVGYQFLGEGAGGVTSAKNAGDPTEQLPDSPMDLRICFQNQPGYAC